MPVQIGSKEHNFNEPIGLLSDCHRRIEMFLGMLKAIAKSVDRVPNEESRRALASALRYFRESAPKHTADEEQSLFPRLRRMAGAEVKQALAKMDELEEEHQQAEILHREVDHLGTSYLRQGSLSMDEVEQFREKVATLSTIYTRHIGVEDTEVFPVAQDALPSSEKQAIAKEMADRRLVKLGAG